MTVGGLLAAGEEPNHAMRSIADGEASNGGRRRGAASSSGKTAVEAAQFSKLPALYAPTTMDPGPGLESLDYDPCESAVRDARRRGTGRVSPRMHAALRWLLQFAIGVGVACVGVLVAVSTRYLADLKFQTVNTFIGASAWG
jgi:hypothetical protein